MTIKPFSELTQEELIDIVSFSTSTTRYFYSKIGSINKNHMIYMGDTYNLNEDLYNQIIEGITQYEIYKLSMTQSQAEELLKEQADKVIQQYYTDKFENLLTEFTSSITTSMSKIQNAETLANSSKDIIESITEDIKILQNCLKENVDNLDLQTTQQKLKEKLNDVKDVKNEFLRELTPVKIEVNELISGLKQLVKV